MGSVKELVMPLRCVRVAEEPVADYIPNGMPTKPSRDPQRAARLLLRIVHCLKNPSRYDGGWMRCDYCGSGAHDARVIPHHEHCPYGEWLLVRHDVEGAMK